MKPGVTVSGRSGGSQRAAENASERLAFKILGTLEVLKNGVDRAPTTPKVLQLLAVLVIRPGNVVHIDSIVHELWLNDPPRSVRKTLHTYVHHLRRWVEWAEPSADPEEVIVTKAPGYLLRIDPAQVDVFDFRRLCDSGRDLLDQRRYDDAAAALRSALDLWSGPPLANVRCGPVLSAYAVELAEWRRNAHRLRIEAEISGGQAGALIGELRSLVAANPLDEALHGQLMRVLWRSGRRFDALACYRQLRRVLHEELGVEPCDEIRLLHRELLSDGSPAI